MRKLVVIALTIALLLSGCSSSSKVSEQNKKTAISKIELIKFAYDGDRKVENQKVYRTTIVEKPQQIENIINALNKKIDPKVTYELSAPIGSINIVYEDGLKETFDLWPFESICHIYDQKTKKVYNIESTDIVQVFYEIFK